MINLYGIASGMEYLHSHEILHRDLNPTNIYLDEFLFPKIGDFGLSTKNHTLDSMTYQTTSGMRGNPTYSSPEVLQFNEYTKSSDVYSFGFIAFEILTGEIPFKGIINKNTIFNEVVNKESRPEIPPTLPNVYRELIERCWSQEKTERPSFGYIVEHLRSDSDFITEQIQQEDYYNYIEFIDESRKSFDSTKRILDLSEFIQAKSKIKEGTTNETSTREEETEEEDTINEKMINVFAENKIDERQVDKGICRNSEEIEEDESEIEEDENENKEEENEIEEEENENKEEENENIKDKNENKEEEKNEIEENENENKEDENEIEEEENENKEEDENEIEEEENENIKDKNENKEEEKNEIEENENENKEDENENKKEDKYDIVSIKKSAMKYSHENDTEKTYIYMSKLASLGEFKVPMEYAVNLYRQKKFKVSMNYFKLLSKFNHPIANFFIAIMKYKGEGCEVDRKESYSILKHLSENGIDKASEFIEDHF